MLSALQVRDEVVGCIRYALRNKQPELEGHFGGWTLLLQESEGRDVIRQYSINKLVFKLGTAEHSISPKTPGDYLGELQLESTLSDGSSDRLAILSLLIEEGDQDHSFISALNPASWTFPK